MNHDQLLHLTMTAVNHALDGNAHGAATALMEIDQLGDPFKVYAACCAFAEVGKAALVKIYGDRAPGPGRDGMWAMQILDAPAPIRPGRSPAASSSRTPTTTRPWRPPCSGPRSRAATRSTPRPSRNSWRPRPASPGPPSPTDHNHSGDTDV